MKILPVSYSITLNKRERAKHPSLEGEEEVRAVLFEDGWLATCGNFLFGSEQRWIYDDGRLEQRGKKPTPLSTIHQLMGALDRGEFL